MDHVTVSFLLDLNRQFYQTFGQAFAATRRRIQPGVRRVLNTLPQTGRWLDIGCGSGALAAAFAESGRQGLYLGVDFSPVLLAEARSSASALTHPGLEIRFDQADLSQPDWSAGYAGSSFDGLLAFAVLHHLPSAALRRHTLAQVHSLLPAGGCFVHSEWQFQHSPKLMARRLPWSSVGLTKDDLEPGDTLLDWRFSLPGQPEQTGRRYVHLFDRPELQELASTAGFEIIDEFESDGEGGRLALYQIWRKT
jgi:SAM-dependent methyltransferase